MYTKIPGRKVDQDSKEMQKTITQKVLGEKVLSKGNTQGFPDGSVRKNPPLNAGAACDRRFNPRVGKSSWSRKCKLTPVFFPGKSHGQWITKSWTLLSTHAGKQASVKIQTETNSF